ncbi:MAG: hypothetical protein J6A79_00195 [Clostridia bacterium]|nr:hypothetical protein [Clostridia bacterium]
MPEQSILKTVRRMIGPDEDYEHFDTDLIIHINSALARLCELGVGPEIPFYITGTEETWSDFIDTGVDERVKQYIVLSVKNIFDPPSSSSVMNAYKEQIEKLEWLLKETAVTGY